MPDCTPDQLATPPVCREVSVLSLEHRAGRSTGESVIFSLRLQFPGWEGWRPGQFVMIRPLRVSRPDVFWARPFSISQANGEEVRIVFQAVGRGTRELLALEPGDRVTLWGPLGNAFALSPQGPTLLLAGGIGIAPFVGYIEGHPAPETLRLEFGHRLPLECYPFADCRATCSPLTARNHQETCADDLARFSQILEDAIRETAEAGGLVLACGPLPFLRAIQKFSLQHKARTQLSLETRMACGVGACLGCVVKKAIPSPEEGHGTTFSQKAPAAFSHVQTCTNGPVFWADQLDIEE